MDLGAWGSTEKIFMDLDGNSTRQLGKGKRIFRIRSNESAFLDLGWYWCVTPRPQGMWHCGTVHPDHGHKQNIQVPTRRVCSKPCGL